MPSLIFRTVAAHLESATANPNVNFWDGIKTCAQLGAALNVTNQQFSLRLSTGQQVSVVLLHGAALLKALEVNDLTMVYLDFWAEKLGLTRGAMSDDVLIARINQETMMNYVGRRVGYRFVGFDANAMTNEEGVLVRQNVIMTEAIVARLSAKAREKGLANADEIALPNLPASHEIYKMFNKADIRNLFKINWFWSEIFVKGMKNDGPLGLADRLSIEDIRNRHVCYHHIYEDRWDYYGPYGGGDHYGIVVLFPQDSK